MKQFKDYDSVQAYADIPQLPRGGYICKIMGAEEKTNSNGTYLDICVDIAEGEFKEFFANDYRRQTSEDKKWHCHYLLNEPKDDGSEQDGWTKRKFKTFINVLEDSNDGYHFDWDESKFKGKLFGGLFNMREYRKNDGSVGEAINLARVIAVEKIRNGDFKVPDDKYLGSAPASAVTFTQIPDSSDDLPF